MLRHLRDHRRDLGYLATLFLIVSVPLILLRALHAYNKWEHTPYHLAVWSSIAAAFLVLWAWFRSSGEGPDEPASIASEPEIPSRLVWFGRAVVFGALVILTLANFYFPCREHFWGGGDDHILFTPWPRWLWANDMDIAAGRPLVFLSIGLSRMLTPERIEGALIVAALLCLTNALLLAGIVGHFFRRDRLIPLIAAALLIANPCDTSRFYVLWTSNCYWSGVFFLLLATWLFLRSHEQGSRAMLAGACTSLGCAALVSEGILPLACLVPGLLLLAPRGRGAWFPWAFGWYGMMSVASVRFILHLKIDAAAAYQAKLLSSANVTLHSLWHNAKIQLSAFWTYFEIPDPSKIGSVVVPCMAAIAAFAAAAMAVSRRREGQPIRTILLGLAMTALALMLGVLPYVVMTHTFRTQFFAGPAQAALLACTLGMLIAWIPGRAGAIVSVATVGCLLVLLTATAWERQRRTAEEYPVTYAKVLDAFEQIHAVSPEFAPDTLVVFVLDDVSRSPFGVSYAPEATATPLLGALVMQTDLGLMDPNVEFRPGGVWVRRQTESAEERTFDYAHVVLFRVTNQGEVTLFREFPRMLLPAGCDATGYEPVARMRPGSIRPLPFFQRPAWIAAPHDVVDYRSGILFGANWGELKFDNGKLSREARDGAEVFINPQDQAQRTLHFRVEVNASSSARVMEALDDAGRVAATTEVSHGGEVILTVPLDATRINAFRLRLRQTGSAPVDGFQIVRIGEDLPFHRKYATPPEIKDINERGVMLGKNWHGRETDAEGNPFRWVENDAILRLIGASGAPAGLLLEVEQGSGTGGQPFDLAVIDWTGGVLTEQRIDGRTKVFVPLPSKTPLGAEIRLRAAGGGQRIATDPRIMNFRVFRAELTNREIQTDVVAHGLKLGPNWFPLETWEGLPFRWINNDAVLHITTKDAVTPKVLEIEVEPGPSLGVQPCRLQVLDEAGSEVATANVVSRETVRLPLPATTAGRTIRLHVPPGDVPVRGEPRLLHFRVFRCRLVSNAVP